MFQTRGVKPRSAMAARTSMTAKVRPQKQNGGNTSPQKAIMELKQRVILILNKLADRDTYQMASEELGRLSASLVPEEFSAFLSCIYETDSQHKTTVRRECVRILATMASVHGELLAPHLAKVMASIVRRLKDPDSNVRDACVDAAGVLAAKVLHRTGDLGFDSGGALLVMIKPLSEALGEQNRYLQAGSALCLARVIENVPNPPVASLQRIVPRILKFLSIQSFTANAALLAVISSIVQVEGVCSQQTLCLLIPCMIDNLQSNDWTTRKATAEAFSCMTSKNSAMLSSFKSSCMAALEACRFDKVKPVRDIVVQTLQAWKSIPDPEESSVENESSRKDKLGEENLKDQSSANNIRPKSKFLRKNDGAVTKSVPDYVSLAKKRAPLADKKTNIHLPKKTERAKSDNWHVEVAVPRASPPRSLSQISNTNDDCCARYSPQLSKENDQMVSKSASTLTFEDQDAFRSSGFARLSDQSRGSCETKCIFVDGRRSNDPTPNSKIAILRTPNSKSAPALPSPYPNGSPRHASPHQASTPQHYSPHNFSPRHSSIKSQFLSSLTPKPKIVNNEYTASNCRLNGEDDVAFIRQHLLHIEDQQANLIELLQVFMGTSLDSIGMLETRVQGLERAINDIAQELSINGNNKTYLERGLRTGRYFGANSLRSNHSRRKDAEESEKSSLFDSVNTVSLMNKTMQVSPSKSKTARTEDCGNNRYQHSKADFKIKPLVDAWEMSFKGYDNASDENQPCFQDTAASNQSLPRALDKLAQMQKYAKATSGRFYQDLKDEPSLSSSYFHDSSFMARSSLSSVSGVGSMASNNENNHFWTVWRRAVDYLFAKEIDSAYMEVLCSGDELLLIQLMKRTGPVPDGLSTGTSNEVLHIAIRLLLEQKFMDTIVPWLTKVVDLVSSNGPDYLGLSMDEKREIMSALQQALTMQFSHFSNRRFVAQIAFKLANAWALDIDSKTCSHFEN